MKNKANENEYNNNNNDEEAEKEQQKQPQMKVTRNIRGGQKREYNFLKSVNSKDELDNIRFENSCLVGGHNLKLLPNFKSRTMPCTRAYRAGVEKCDFQLIALRSASEHGIIHIYAHSKHNHPIIPEEKRATKRRANELMAAENPPRIFHTPDNTEWKFIQTFPDYDQMQHFRRKSQCRFNTRTKTHWRFRLLCNQEWWHNCPFKLLAMKTTKEGYHVYTFGQHTHPATKPRKKQQPAARSHMQKRQKMEVDEEEEEEAEEDEDEDDKNEEENETEEESEEEENETEEESEEEEDEKEGDSQDEPIEEGDGGGEEEEDDDRMWMEDEGELIEEEKKGEEDETADVLTTRRTTTGNGTGILKWLAKPAPSSQHLEIFETAQSQSFIPGKSK